MKDRLAIEEPVKATLTQLYEVLSQLTAQEYSKPLDVLSNSSIGQHARHIIEFFKALLDGYEKGLVDYDKRKRNYLLETDPGNALMELSFMQVRLDRPDKTIQLTGSYSANHNEEVTVKTSYRRELAYNLEHMIHHMAIIKIAIRHSTSLLVPPEFGVAAATLRYQRSVL